MFLDHVTDCALKGLGEQVWTMWVNIADSALSIVLVLIFLPPFGAVGYVYVIFLAELFNFTLSFARLCYVTTIRYRILRSFVPPIVFALLSVFLVRGLFHIDPMVATLPWVLMEILFAACAYIGSLMLLTFFSKLGKGKRWAYLDILG
jgi:O-antigen/teichoic acid export membrane protein